MIFLIKKKSYKDKDGLKDSSRISKLNKSTNN